MFVNGVSENQISLDSDVPMSSLRFGVMPKSSDLNRVTSIRQDQSPIAGKITTGYALRDRRQTSRMREHNNFFHSQDENIQVRDGVERRRVLLLNASFEPLSLVSIRRAIVLILSGRADAVHDDPESVPFSSISISVQSPLVIRLRHYVKVPYRSNIPLTRAALMQRDHSTCAYCGGRADTIDHVIPRSKGGKHSWENCVASCGSCNHRKGDKLLSEMGWSLHQKPTTPKDKYWRLLSKVKDMHPIWAMYLQSGAA